MGLMQKIKRKCDGLEQRLGLRNNKNKLTKRGWRAYGLGLLTALSIAGGDLYIQNINDHHADYSNYEVKRDSDPKYIYNPSTHISCPKGFDYRKDTESNRVLDDFPKEIPGAAVVDKYAIPDAKYCLVHVRQAHLPGNFIGDMTVDLAYNGRIKNNQENIYKILNFLYKNDKLDEVYCEGLCDNDESRVNLKLIEARMLGIKTNFSDRADIRICFEQGIPLLAAEKRSVFDQASLIKKQDFFARHSLFTDKRISEPLLDNREDALLEIISARQEEPLAVTVYGGAHTWGGYKSFGHSYPLSGVKGRSSYRDNIYEWNQKHPDKKFSLIEITPLNYPKPDGN